MSHVILLQGTVISLLTQAQSAGWKVTILPNLSQVMGASGSARDGSIMALQEQFQRMMVAAPIRQNLVGRYTFTQGTPSAQNTQQALVQPVSKTLRTLPVRSTAGGEHGSSSP